MTADDIGPDQPELNVIALLQSALDTFPLPSVAIDPAMRIVAVNVALREFLDEPALEVTTYEDLARRYLTEGNAKRVSETVRQAMTEATPRSSVEVEVTARRDFVFRIEIRRLEVPGIEL